MKPYLLSLAAGLLAGGLYSLLGVKSPAPPMIALIGLLGILLGERVVPIARLVIAGQPIGRALAEQDPQQGLGRLPGDASAPAASRAA
jgi:XapX domain-containing protein